MLISGTTATMHHKAHSRIGKRYLNYTAAVDNPACCVWKELMVAYPGEKCLTRSIPVARKPQV